MSKDRRGRKRQQWGEEGVNIGEGAGKGSAFCFTMKMEIPVVEPEPEENSVSDLLLVQQEPYQLPTLEICDIHSQSSEASHFHA